MTDESKNATDSAPKPKTGLELLREPFPPHQIGKLAKGSKDQTQCPASEKRDCKVCGGWHHPKMIHLDYVGHAALTDRLLDADPAWHWEPIAWTDAGMPAFDDIGGLWIKLTVCGVTRLGYGNAADSQYKEIGSRQKEVIGDALRNAAMRFGAALELWHKGDLHKDDDPPADPPTEDKPRITSGVIKPTDGAWEALTPPEAARVRKLANRVLDGFVSGQMDLAYTAYLDAKEQLGDDINAKMAIWTLFDSKQRRILKDMDAQASIQAMQP